MELFHVISITVPLLIAIGLPGLLNDKRATMRTNIAILYVACILFFISWYLPSPLINGEDTSFVTHFIGGGLFSALLWWYICRSRGMRFSWWRDVTLLFALVSTLGVANELFELILVQAGVASILITDTSWDLVANTAGAMTGYVLYRLGEGALGYDSRH